MVLWKIQHTFTWTKPIWNRNYPSHVVFRSTLHAELLSEHLRLSSCQIEIESNRTVTDDYPTTNAMFWIHKFGVSCLWTKVELFNLEPATILGISCTPWRQILAYNGESDVPVCNNVTRSLVIELLLASLFFEMSRSNCCFTLLHISNSWKHESTSW